MNSILSLFALQIWALVGEVPYQSVAGDGLERLKVFHLERALPYLLGEFVMLGFQVHCAWI